MAEAAAKTVWKISQGHLECPICCCLFKDPKMLDCLHSFCLKCLDEMMSRQKPEAEKITCPVCRRETQVPDGGLQSLASSFFLSSLVDEVKQQGKHGHLPPHVTVENARRPLGGVSIVVITSARNAAKLMRGSNTPKTIKSFHWEIGRNQRCLQQNIANPSPKCVRSTMTILCIFTVTHATP
ncbi:tripartite motif-containing protein 3-like [Patiria miniata]|uniref:RING-type domain-containing protein n=1 Tax=Patiria miniata TaxID=46514 RepID=A0A913ZZQ5_PATMI|nr:tripartite motif-containing protein 3-like [Patiria miniata]